MLQQDYNSSDARDAAKLAVLCIDTALSATARTRYKVESRSDPLDRDEVIAYLTDLPKPVAIGAERTGKEWIALHAAPRQPAKGDAQIEILQLLRDSSAIEEGALVLVKRENDPQFSLRLSGIALWQHSYQLHVDYMWMFRDPDDSAKAANASVVMQIGVSDGSDVSAVFLR